MTEKIAIIGDTHFSPKDYDLKKEFFDNYIIEKKYTTIFFQGDVFDNRKNLDVNMLSNTITDIFDKLINTKIYIIVGNHDLYFKNDKKISSVKLLEKIYSNITIIETDTMIKIDNDFFYCIPYDFIPNPNLVKDANYILGHIEVYPFFPSSKITIKDFQEKKTMLGHHHQKKDVYMGTPYALDFNDLNETKGFYEITDTLNYIENKISPKFLSIYYNHDYLLIEEEKRTIQYFLNNYDKRNNYYIYIEEDINADDFIEILDENKIKYKIQIISTKEEIDEEQIIFEDQNIFDIVNDYIEESSKEKLSEIKEKILNN
jgi:hypothetical protein